MNQSLAQKLIARAAGRSSVAPGEIVTCKVDLAMIHDSSGPRRVKPMLERLGAKVWDPSKVVLITDHYVPAYDEESRRIIRITREWVREAGIDNFHDEHGICHVVLPEPELLQDGPVLPEPRRALRGVLPGGVEALGGSLPRRLRLPPRADGSHADF
jgi:3-isopropylmalate/(R)-2-methylmalate dehydratase large subunit